MYVCTLLKEGPLVCKYVCMDVCVYVEGFITESNGLEYDGCFVYDHGGAIELIVESRDSLVAWIIQSPCFDIYVCMCMHVCMCMYVCLYANMNACPTFTTTLAPTALVVLYIHTKYVCIK